MAVVLFPAAYAGSPIGSPDLGNALDAWRHLPVLDDGRVMPLDTFARRRVETITNSQAPMLSTDSGGTQLRRWEAAELLLDWLSEPAAWEDVAFLIAEHEGVREILDLPVFETHAEGRRRLKYAAPSDVADSAGLRARLVDIDERRRDARMKGLQFELLGVDAKVDQLWKAYVTWRQLTFRATDDSIGRSRFIRLFMGDNDPMATDSLARSWSILIGQCRPTDPSSGTGSVESSPELGKTTEQIDHAEKIGTALQTFEKNLSSLGEIVGQSTRFETELVLASVLELKMHAEELKIILESNPSTRPPALRTIRKLLCQIDVLGESLYDNGDGVLLIPALHAEAIENEREPSEDMSPWLALSTLLDAPLEILSAYPRGDIERVRGSFAAVRTALLAPSTAKDHGGGIHITLMRFADALQALGTDIEPLREKLPLDSIDADLMRYTAYPPAGSTAGEVRYNTSDPFRGSWIASLLAMTAFALAFGRARSLMFWIGVLLLITELAWTAMAFSSRIAITRWAPVTNMYETVIYVPFFLSFLGLWFILAPAFSRGVRSAWRLTAIPPPLGSLLPGEATVLDQHNLSIASAGIWNGIGWFMLVPRIAMSACVLWILAMAPYAAAGRTIISLLPQTDIDSSIPNLNNLVVWLVGISMLVPAVCFLPRVILTAMASIIMVPLSWRGGYLASTLSEVYQRTSFGLVVTTVAFAGTFIAWFFPIPGKQFSPLQPVLRDNFWLTIHVLTIVSSYAAGALAWGLGCLSLGYYLFGTYRTQSRTTGKKRLAPEACTALAGYIYKAMQVAVMLLAAGTILGGLWADVSWGRFWGWDPKEVWALVSLLAYLVVLHGRYAGWIGNFGIAAGSVAGAAVIGMSWYGVNFLLGAGLHSYGFGKGGQTEFFSFLVLNFLLLFSAGVRLRRETGNFEAAQPSEPDLVAIDSSGASR